MNSMKNRMVGADIIKIASAFFVIFIHHKKQNSQAFHTSYHTMLLGFLIAACIVSALIYHCKKHRFQKRTSLFLAVSAPLWFFLCLVFTSRFAVSFFLMISGFLFTASIEKYVRPAKEWYRLSNIIPRILRFYLPLIPVLAIGILVHITCKEIHYDLIGILKRILRGGFKPGGYYITVMVQCLLIFPLLYLIVKKFRRKGLVLILTVTLIWDILATKVFPVSEQFYQYCMIRLLPQVSFGIYAKRTELQKNPVLHGILFAVGLVYVIVFIFSRSLPLPFFYQWRDSSLVIAIFLYPIVVFLLSFFQKFSYTDSALSRNIIQWSNATYHIFLFQMLYYNLFGYSWNARVNNIPVTMPVNLAICLTGGFLFYRLASPWEQKLLKTVKKLLTSRH